MAAGDRNYSTFSHAALLLVTDVLHCSLGFWAFLILQHRPHTTHHSSGLSSLKQVYQVQSIWGWMYLLPDFGAANFVGWIGRYHHPLYEHGVALRAHLHWVGSGGFFVSV